MLFGKHQNKKSLLSRLVSGENEEMELKREISQPIKKKKLEEIQQNFFISKEKCFNFADGSSACDLKSLTSKIRSLEYDEYYRLTHPENHFANWIEQVIGDRNLALKIRSAKNKEEILSILS